MSALNNSVDMTYNYIRYRTENASPQPGEQPTSPLSLQCWRGCLGRAPDNTTQLLQVQRGSCRASNILNSTEIPLFFFFFPLSVFLFTVY